ncbi:MAG: NADH-quinone oxidoreductase subunit J, partial [Calditrichaeota bacterium]|nr:NADH-quinone oxidoreductase subunit J [Calditrichota bacterium]
MNLAIPFFWCFAFASIALALGVVLSRRILRSALYLTGVLLCGAVFYLLLGAEFLAGIQILVYIG